jgi:hypothetical protein
VLNQVEEGRFRPVDVVEDDDDGLVAREAFEELAHAPERLLARAGFASPREEAPDQRDDPIGVVRANEQRPNLRTRRLEIVVSRDAGGLLDDLGEREERDAVAVRQAAAAQHPGGCSRTGQELLHQPRLPDARGTEEGEQVRGSFAHCVGKSAFEELMLLRPPDHRRVEMTCVPFGSLEHAHEAVGSDAFRLALQLECFDGLDLDRVLDQAICGIAEQNLAGRGRLLQAGRDVHRVAGH